MATSGRALAAAAVGLVLLVTGAGCTATPTPAPDSSASSSSGTFTESATVPSSTGSPTPVRPARQVNACLVDLPKTWTKALKAAEVTTASGTEQSIRGAYPGGWTFATSTEDGRTVFEWRRGDRSGTVQDFGAKGAEWQVLGTSFDGRYLAYSVYESPSDLQLFSLWVWDAKSKAKPTRISRNATDSDGEPLPSPFLYPVAHDGWVYWTQTRGHDSTQTVLSAYEISDRRRQTLARGYGTIPVRFGGLLVWPDAPGPKQTTTLRAIDLSTRQPATLPPPLQDVRGTFYLTGSEDTFAWVSGARDAQELWAWRTDWPEPRRLLVGKQYQFPRIADNDTVVWSGGNAMYLADLRTWSYTKMTPRWGGINADGGPVVQVQYASTSNKGPTAKQALLDVRKVPPLGRAGC